MHNSDKKRLIITNNFIFFRTGLHLLQKSITKNAGNREFTASKTKFQLKYALMITVKSALFKKGFCHESGADLIGVNSVPRYI